MWRLVVDPFEVVFFQFEHSDSGFRSEKRTEGIVSLLARKRFDAEFYQGCVAAEAAAFSCDLRC